jgi:four helix bundle protein
MGERRLENLEVWCDARIFVVEVYKMMETVKDYGFKDQIQRAAVSIMNNIAEGFESGSDAAFVRYLNISKGSCSEVKSMLYLCGDLQYCSTEQQKKLLQILQSISNRIFKLIEYLKK